MNKLGEFISHNKFKKLALDLNASGFSGIDNLQGVIADGYYFTLPILQGLKNVTLEILIEPWDKEPNRISVWFLLDTYEAGLEVFDQGDICFFYNCDINKHCAVALRKNIYTILNKIVIVDSTVADCSHKFNGNMIEVFIEKALPFFSLAKQFNERGSLEVSMTP